MKNLLYLTNSFFASLIITTIILTASFLIMLFSSGGTGYRTAYFGSLFFNSREKGSGTLGMELGVSNFWPIVLTILILTILIYFLTRLFIKRIHSQ
ncbi:hypothetical protein N9R04_09810 [Staphylococcus sp. SQ8-PEA]|uniref:Uncharacterized protein n=1 Tax=Staphylococcus marylandisciuri TaxID=2981529 RepID=A0ABT2QSP5_9STAP|nr:hypothetical protein [Staphylococcus marylandisciuri]MCU5746972.1 hypothetical protein [Staphylococcus marylandisciuri]